MSSKSPDREYVKEISELRKEIKSLKEYLKQKKKEKTKKFKEDVIGKPSLIGTFLMGVIAISVTFFALLYDELEYLAWYCGFHLIIYLTAFSIIIIVFLINILWCFKISNEVDSLREIDYGTAMIYFQKMRTIGDTTFTITVFLFLVSIIFFLNVLSCLEILSFIGTIIILFLGILFLLFYFRCRIWARKIEKNKFDSIFSSKDSI